MVDKTEKKEDNRKDEIRDESPEKLNSDFFHNLLKTPPCKIDGTCNNCGRCEH
jgi:hypothetical protein